MAGDWIKLEHATPNKPEVFRIAEILSLPPEHALGCLIRVWMWADEQAETGNVASVTETIVDRITGVSGFGNAMVNVGWLTVFEAGILFPNFSRHNGQTAKTRALTAKRVAKHKQTSGNAKVTQVALPREEKRREEKSIKTPLPPLPENLQTEQFRQAWECWTRHRVEIKKPLKPTQLQAILAKLSGWGHDRAIAAIDHTIAMGWQGLREPDQNSNGRPPKETLDELNRKAIEEAKVLRAQRQHQKVIDNAL